MRKCKKCGIILLDHADTCPLCHHALTVSGEDKIDQHQTVDAQNKSRMYPNIIRKQRKMSLILRILLFAAVVVTIVCGFINYQVNPDFPWSVIPAATIWYVAFVFLLFIRVEGYMRRVFAGVFVGFSIILLIDIVFGFHRWSVNYVLPGSVFLIDLMLLVLMIINRRNWQSYMIFQILMILVGIVTLILVKAGVVTYPIVSEAAFLSAVIVFVGTLILGGASAIQELHRRFHL